MQSAPPDPPVNPIPSEELEATRSFYDRIAAVYDTLSDASERDARQRGLRLLAVQPGERVLEIGFGTGHALVELAEAVGPAGSVAGVDISERMLQLAQERAERAGVAARVRLQVEAVPPLPYPDDSFDAVFLSFTLELFPEAAIGPLLSEVRRVLRPGGRLGVVAMAAHADEPDSLLERAYKWMHRHFPHIVDCRPIDVARVLRDAGLTVASREDLSIWSLSVAAIVARAGEP